MDWLIFAIVGGLAILVGHKVVRFEFGREVQFGAFVVGIFLLGMGTTDLMTRLNNHDGLGGKLGDEPRPVRVVSMNEEQVCFILLDNGDKGCALRSDLIGLDWALRATPFIGPEFQVQRLEEGGVYRGVEILNPHNQQH